MMTEPKFAKSAIKIVEHVLVPIQVTALNAFMKIRFYKTINASV